jgi:predicted kinase
MIDLAPATPVDAAAVTAFLGPIAAVAELAATPQDAAFHAEGDVWTHTQMAIQALVDGAAYAALTPLGRRIVAAAVLLHDIGKPATTRDEGGKLTSRGHSAKGEGLARAALWRLGVPFAVREHVCALIRSHQVPFFGITKPAGEATRLARRLSLVLRHDWLVAVADADARGRRCADPADQVRIVDYCALWAEHARELAILDRAQPFASPHTRRVWCESETRPPEVVAHDDTACEVVLMSGLPAAGKDTWLATHRPELPVISLDELRADLDVDPDDGQAPVIAAARERARDYLRSATSFAWNATNLTRSLRGQLLELFRSYRARTHVVYCEASTAEQERRNRSRREPVPRAVVARMIERWTVPDPTEAHEVTYVVPHGDGDGDVVWPPESG